MFVKLKKQLISEYINNVAKQVNELYPYLIDNEKKIKAIEQFSSLCDDYETVVKKIDSAVEYMIKDRKIIVENSKLTKTEDLSKFTLNIGAIKNGLYLSQQQIDLLMITEINSKNELEHYFADCAQFPNEKLKDVIKNYDDITLDNAKKALYAAYVNKLDSYIENANMNNMQKAISKLTKMRIKKEEQKIILKIFEEDGLNRVLQYLKSSKGDSYILQFNRFIRDDYENVKSVGYDQMCALSRLIDRDETIKFITTTSGKYENTMISNGIKYYFDPYSVSRAIQYCEKHNIHMKYHTLFDYGHIEKLLLNGKSAVNKNEILSAMKEYVQLTMTYITQHNKILTDGTPLINMVEVFNELVERNKSQSEKKEPYAMKWEKEFGITIEDIMFCFKGVKKPENVEFIYNETMLTESSYKRDKVESVLGQIEKIAPGFIDRFGDQAHLDEDDLNNDGYEIIGTAKMLARIQSGIIRVAKSSNGDYINQIITPKKIDMTEHDFHFSKNFVEKMLECVKYKIIDLNSIQIIKKNMQGKIAEIYKQNGVNFECIAYWTLFDKNDHNLVRANRKIIDENPKKQTHALLLENMYAGVFGSGKQIDNIKKL